MEEDKIMYFVYMLICKSKKGKLSHYTGYTNDLKRRFKEHEKGHGAKYTRGKKIQLAYYEEYYNKIFAIRRERAIKKLSVKEKKEFYTI